MNIQITSDRMIDLSDEELKLLNIKTISCFVNMGGKSYEDLIDVFPRDIFEYVRKTGKVAQTAAKSPEAYLNFFNQYANADTAIIHIACSSGISSIASNAEQASKIANGKVFVVDSLSAGNGLALIAYYIIELIKQGLSAEEISELAKKMVPKITCSFLLNTLTCLHKGGRCSALTYYSANILKIKPVIYFDTVGRMVVREKIMGSFNSAVKKYIRNTFNKYPNPDLSMLYIEESTPSEDMRNMLLEEIGKYHKFENIKFNVTSCNSCIHSGENIVGLMFVNN